MHLLASMSWQPPAPQPPHLQPPPLLNIQIQCFLCWLYIRKYVNIFVFPLISKHWESVSNRNPTCWKTICLCFLVNSMVHDNLVIQRCGIDLVLPGSLQFQHPKGYAILCFENLYSALCLNLGYIDEWQQKFIKEWYTFGLNWSLALCTNSHHWFVN